ncbi:ABC transporter permease [Rhodobium gokarnense]|uniref:Spermidine/putrescine transport system permease protein n=1 Tax=Rhodobium gokarnense TaxID=364296 RepID=A0ABT3HG96_9HYPH|nr:ABC transporter permease [Rhodobium gokarnense]MCW2309374.1 putative spermidine/putrescine transport system permease protein [Rhodobium gokarnense]
MSTNPSSSGTPMRFLTRNLSLPVLVTWLIYVFLLVPSLVVIPISFGTSNELVFPPQDWGLDLYRRALDPAEGWLSAAGRSTMLGILATAIALLMGVPAAYGLSRSRFPGQKALTFMLMSPIFAPTIVVALALYLYFATLGMTGTMVALAMSHAVVITPFILVTTLSGLKHLDRNIENAAMVMGATRLQIFFHVVLPALKGSVLTGGLFAFLLSFDEVIVSWFIARSDQPTLPVKMYSSIQWEISPVLSAISTFLVAITVVGSVVAAFTSSAETDGI